MKQMDDAAREKGIYRITLTGSFVNLALLVLKFAAGIAAHSAAMLADAVHSLSDFATDIVVMTMVHISSKPEDSKHAYGHGKFETLATLIVGLLLFTAGGGIIANATQSILNALSGQTLAVPGIWALVAALASIATKEVLYQYTISRGRALHSQAVIANAWHHRSDAFSSLGTALGIGGAIVLGESWAVLDPLAAGVAGLFIIKVAWNIAKESMDELLEKALPAETEEEIKNIILSVPQVSAPHHLRTRRVGNHYAMDVHVRMNGEVSLTEAHDTASTIERALRKRFGQGTYVNIHMEPTKHN